MDANGGSHSPRHVMDFHGACVFLKKNDHEVTLVPCFTLLFYRFAAEHR